MKIWRVPYPKFGHGPALERVSLLAEHLGVDLKAFGPNAVAVIGSNGKGSTAAMTAGLIAHVEPNVGLFTSPHLLDLNERFRIGDNDIGDDELAHHWDRVEDAIVANGLAWAVGGFEFLFLIAADWFQARACVHTVWEAGLGGRLDPARLIEAGHTALTALDLEHTALLGNSLREISLEKIAAVKPGNVLGVSDVIKGDAEVFGAIETWAATNNVQVVVTPAMNDAPLAGLHQRTNAGLAHWLANTVTSIPQEVFRTGWSALRWPGRLEVLSNDPLEIIDVGHTPDGVRAALAGFNEVCGGRSAVLVCGASEDKDADAIISRLAPSFSRIICASAMHKGAPAARIAAFAQNANSTAEITLAESVVDARRLALSKAGGGAIYVAGGLFLAAEFKAVHLGRDPASLVFF
jgi:dihydrofolate synthase/folylpolyglutamate synthase